MSEVYTIIGVSNYNFERDGRTYSGLSLYCTFVSQRVNGLCCEKVSVSSSILDNLDGETPKVGDKVQFFYNRYGRVSGLEFV